MKTSPYRESVQRAIMACGWTLQDVADAVGLKYNNFYNCISRRPSEELAQKIAATIGCRPLDLMPIPEGATRNEDGSYTFTSHIWGAPMPETAKEKAQRLKEERRKERNRLTAVDLEEARAQNWMPLVARCHRFTMAMNDYEVTQLRNTIGARLRLVARIYSETQRQFARFVGYNESTLAGWMHRNDVPADVLDNIANLCEGLSRDWLLTGKGATIMYATGRVGKLGD